MVQRTPSRVLRGRTTRDGAGVKLQRIFSADEASLFDPFLLLDAFGADDPRDYVLGFPMHPHRGLETVTYLLRGTVRHRDSLGNGGVIGPGDLQWMSAGSGIIHEEMPQESEGGLLGVQLWVNLPRSDKMRPPAYRGVTASQVPAVKGEGSLVRVLAGTWGGAEGPVVGVARSPVYLDVELGAGAQVTLDAAAGRTAFLLVVDGEVGVETDSWSTGACVLLGDGDEVTVWGGAAGGRLLFVHAPPLREPIAWGGPIVMNTEEELEQAFRELREGTFIRA